MLANVSVEGTHVTLSDIAVFGESDMARGELGSGGVSVLMGELRTRILPEAARQGFTTLRITGVRISGNVGHAADLNFDLSKFAPGGGGQ
jgi:hypothetical protein